MFDWEFVFGKSFLFLLFFVTDILLLMIPIFFIISGSSSGEECSDEQFQCADKCIPKRWQCDYHKDCENGEDEQDCRKF